MRTPRSYTLSVFLIAAAIALAGVAAAGPQDQSAKVEIQKEKKLQQGEKDAKKMLLLMDKDKNGKVSKEEFMSFMEAEFERLDVNHDGELDVQELTGSRVQIRTRGR